MENRTIQEPHGKYVRDIAGANSSLNTPVFNLLYGETPNTFEKQMLNVASLKHTWDPSSNNVYTNGVVKAVPVTVLEAVRSALGESEIIYVFQGTSQMLLPASANPTERDESQLCVSDDCTSR